MHYLNLFTWEKEYNDVCIIKFLFNPCQTTSNLKPILTSQFFISGISKSIPTQNSKPNEPEISSLPNCTSRRKHDAISFHHRANRWIRLATSIIIIESANYDVSSSWARSSGLNAARIILLIQRNVSVLCKLPDHVWPSSFPWVRASALFDRRDPFPIFPFSFSLSLFLFLPSPPLPPKNRTRRGARKKKTIRLRASFACLNNDGEICKYY